MAPPDVFARLVARPVDRVHIAASTVPTLEELMAIEGFYVSPGHAAPMAAFLSVPEMAWDHLRLPLRYVPEERIRAMIESCVERNVITFDGETIAYTPAGQRAAEACLDARAVDLEAMWSNTPGVVEELVDLLEPVDALARAAGKPSSRLVDRALATPNPTPGSDLWRLLAQVRRFRADCHAEAWAETGHTVETIVALAQDAPERAPIEARTDDLNGVIWAGLSETEQLRCLAALAALDGSGTPT